jgi:hypothetical protein
MAAEIDQGRANEAERRMQFADAAQGLAGHELSDQLLRELSHQVAAGAIRADDAISAGMTHLRCSAAVIACDVTSRRFCAAQHWR